MDIRSYKQQMKRLTEKYETAKERLNIAYAMGNAYVRAGSFIRDKKGEILVDAVGVHISDGGLPECIYRGDCYTLKGRPFRSGARRSIKHGDVTAR